MIPGPLIKVCALYNSILDYCSLLTNMVCESNLFHMLIAVLFLITMTLGVFTNGGLYLEK
jgi:hypothetical protein